MTHLTAWRDKKVLILGSGGLQIAQAGEFDYSGSQAIKALNQHQVKTILVNPNVATVQTDLADRTYLEPLTLEIAHQIIARERPDGILLSVGGQTALNLGLALHRQGIFQKYQVSVLGTSIQTIEKTENRDSFNADLQRLNIKTAVSNTVSSVQDALNVAERIGYPVMMRIGFSLGGLGSGVVKSPQQLKKQAQECFHYANQILIEEYLSGWKEFEYEIIRDESGNRLVICTMENMDPMGIHTGESIVVAPAQTLCDRQYHALREIALQVAQHFNIIGECNIQFAINPVNGDYRVIELNARLSRSSALASKATGYPLAFIATKLALGYRLHELKNTVTQETCAFFEPALDYLVVKIPRWDTQKLKAADRHLGSEMKSVGEVMAIGRSFQEALQKAAGMLNIGASCLSDYFQIDAVEDEIANATDRRLFALYQYFKSGGTVEHAAKLSQIDPWFLTQICEIAHYECAFQQETKLNAQQLLQSKQLGFSDQVIARWFGVTEQEIRAQRLHYGITPYVKQIDTLAAEFAAETNYLYLTYHAIEHDVLPHEGAVILLGSGVYAIGTSVEFDWCAVNTTRTLKELSQYCIVINSNPETVSTDYDQSDRLYFEQLTLERVRDIADFEHPVGIIVSVGGQIANNLALPLSTYGYPLLGTCAQSIELAENRQKFSNLLMQLAINQPLWRSVKTLAQAKEFCDQVGYPVLIRPSYILSGAAMNVVYDESSLEAYLTLAMQASEKQAVVISQFVTDAKELEIDGVAQAGNIVISAISEHIENAGVHSGDATVVLPPQKLYLETIRRTKAIARTIVNALSITGPFNIQFIAKNNAISVIECNLRASRSLPFVSKATGYNFMRIATEVLLGKYTPKNYETLELDYVAVKAAKFSYARLKGSNPVAHVEMASTGEVACLADDFEEAFFKAWLATDQTLINKNILLSISDAYKQKLLPVVHQLQTFGWSLYATEGTHHFLNRNQLASVLVYKISQEQSPNIQTLIHQRTIGLIVNLPSNSGQNTDGFLIRRLAIDHHIPLVTNAQAALTLLHCLTRFFNQNLSVRSWQEFIQTSEKYFCLDRTSLPVL